MASTQKHEASGVVPAELDILCGKTKQIINHPGTIRYQKVVESYTQRYINAESKFDKMTVTKSLYEYLKRTSRFLKFNAKEQVWEEITSLAARDKIGHALRFAVNNRDSDKAKKRAKRRSHKAVESDFTSASLTSLTSDVSAKNGPFSDSVPMVQSLMQALTTISNQSSPIAAKATAFPTVSTSSDHSLPPPLLDPKMTPATRGGNTGSNLSDLGLPDSNMSHSELAFAAIAAEMATATTPPAVPPSDQYVQYVPFQNLLTSGTLNTMPISRGTSTGSVLSLPTSNPQLASTRSNSTGSDLSLSASNRQLTSSAHSGSSHQMAPSPSPPPPLPVVVTTPDSCKNTGSGVQTPRMNSEFLSMLKEPIYEVDLENQDEDL